MKVEVKLKYIQGPWTDALGRTRYRLRRKGFPYVELPVNSDPASPEFQAAYHAALRNEKQEHAIAMIAARGGTGTVANAIEQYLNSTTFRSSAQSTQALRRPILKGFLKPGVGNLQLAKMDRRYIERWLETAPTMGAKRTWLLALKPFMQWAVEPMHLIEADPTEGIKVKVKESDGHASWSDGQVAQFRAHYPLGTKARLALELLLGVTLRRGDGISLGPQHVKDGWLVYVQEKNRKRKPQKVETPLPTELVTAIKACPSPPDSLTFLTNEQGRPFSKRTFNRWFRKQVAAAGLPDSCVPHGLRKGGGCIMAESECTPHEIMSVMGHSSLKEAERYTRSYDRRRSAARAQEKVVKAKAKAAAAQAELEAESNVVTLPVASR
jgi:integrase